MLAYVVLLAYSGEPIRIALHAAGLVFEDCRVPFGEWAALKATHPSYAGGLPVIEINGAMHNQSLAIIRWAGKQGGGKLYPVDPLQALVADKVMDTCADALNKCPGGSTDEEKKKAREEYSAGKLKGFFDMLNVAAVAAGPEAFIAGGTELTVADLTLYYFLLDMLRQGQVGEKAQRRADVTLVRYTHQCAPFLFANVSSITWLPTTLTPGQRWQRSRQRSASTQLLPRTKSRSNECQD